MLSFIEGLLERKTKGTTNEILYTHWSAAKYYIFQVLDIVSHTFPHYSMHDKSHADTILKNIVRIVGRRTIEEEFTAIDVWLMLMAAYYHDCGMAVFATDKLDAFQKDSGFVKYIISIQENKNSPLYEYAQYLEIKDGIIHYKNNELTAKSYESAKYLLADYVRKEHSERSFTRIQESNSLHLPGDPIPERLIYWLSEICRVHTCTFNEVMRLPFSENGCDDEDCHPRYIACVLRIGDLLDMDNNRISELLLSTLGVIPYDSLQHKQKTASIRRLEFNTKEVSIIAECETYEIADLTNKWFDWINEEFTNQLKNWNKIVPNLKYGYLPTIGDLSVNLKNFDMLDGKVRPQFSINPQKAIELLQGAGLYSNPCQAIRELLQNATDATYLRLWKEYKDVIHTLNDFKKICSQTKIMIELSYIGTEEEEAIWEVKIIDKGIGMSKTDLQFLAQTGSSNKNKEKKDLIAEMPIWMKPSGIFGIGFQSVFLLTNQVILNTKKYHKEQFLHIELNNPTREKEGSILVQTTNNEAVGYGTELVFNIRMPKTFYWSIGLNEHNAARAVNTFDFATDEFLNVTIGKIGDEIIQFANYSMIPIAFTIDGIEYVLQRQADKENIENCIFYEDLGIEIQLGNAVVDENCHTITNVHYRNQPVECKNLHIPFWGSNVNILKDDATKVVTLNRNQIQRDYKEGLHKDIIVAILRTLLQQYDKLEGVTKYCASMFIEMNRQYMLEDMDSKYIPSWECFELKYYLKEQNLFQHITIKDLLEDCVEIIVSRNSLCKYELLFKKETEDILIDSSKINSDVINFLCYILKEKYHYIEYTSNGILIKERENAPVYISDFKRWFSHYISRNHYARDLMPCSPKYSKLAVDNIDWFDSTFDGFYIKYPVMICPYIREYNDSNNIFSSSSRLEYSISDKVIDLTFEHLTTKGVTKEDIKSLYELFKEDFEAVISEINEERQKSK